MKAWYRGSLSLGLFAGLIYLENRRPLRRERESKPRRVARNLAIAGLSALTIQYAETPIVSPISDWVGRRRFGLLKIVRLPRFVEMGLAVMLMDYTLYLWHVLTHRVPLLWRFHAVHHVDRDLDASTALRFHFGELLLSVPYRAMQILVIGVDRSSFAAWQSFLSISILFHHSNLRLPLKAERVVSSVWVTPTLHGLHHSNDPELGACNWSSGLTIWDTLHRTFRTEPTQERLTMGVAGIDDDQRCGMPGVLLLPVKDDADIEGYRRAAVMKKESEAIQDVQALSDQTPSSRRS